MRLNMDIDPTLTLYQKGIERLSGKDQHKVYGRALNHTIGKARTQVIRATARQSSIPQKIVRASLQTLKASPGSGSALEAKIIATGKPIPLKDFKAKQFGYGVKATIWGKQTRFPGMFIWAGQNNSGKYVGAGHVFARLTKRSTPIEKQYGPSVPEEIVKDEADKAFNSTVDQTLPPRILHELGRALPK